MTLLTLTLVLLKRFLFQPLAQSFTQPLTQRVTNRISLNRQLKTLALCVGLLLPFLSTSVQAQGQTTFVPIAVGDILTFIPLLSSPTQMSVKAEPKDGNYQLKWNTVPQAHYYQIIITDEKGKQRIEKVSGTSTSYTLAGLSLGNNKVEFQACNQRDQCGVLSLVSYIKRKTKITYQHTDMLGSPVMQSDEAGNVLSRSVYDPFGKRLGGDKAGIGYTGHLQDKDLGLTYMQARYYDPLIGRFYSNDPVGFVGNSHSFNRYAYANNNPYKYVDPNGESPENAAFYEGNFFANWLGYSNANEATIHGQRVIDSNRAAFQSVPNYMLDRTSISLAATAGRGPGVTSSLEVNSHTFQGDGFKLDAGLTGATYTPFGPSLAFTVNYALIQPDPLVLGPATTTTFMAGSGFGGGATIQWTPSFGVTLHAGPVLGVSFSSKVGGIETQVFSF